MSFASTDSDATKSACTLNVMANPLGKPLRMVIAGMLVGLLWKVTMFIAMDRVYQAYPIDHSFFPDWLQSAMTLRFAYIFAVGSLLLGMLTSCEMQCRRWMWTSLIAVTVMLLHQGSYNDMTFVTVWWCNVWCVWYVGRLQFDSLETLLPKAALLSRLIASVVLLGGASGKWTAEYWSGDVFYEIYFAERDFWLFNILRSSFDEERLRWISMIYSRKVILLETAAGMGLWMLPPRTAALFGMLIFTSIALLSNYYLFSVLGPMIGLAAVGLLIPRESR